MQKVVKREEIYHGKIVDLIVDTVEHSEGHVLIREVVHHSHGVVTVPMLTEHQILFVRQHRYPFDKRLLELPAGKVDPGESPEACAVRELEEETGYRAGRIQKLCQIYPSPGYCDEVIHLYLATDLLRTQQALEIEEESITVETYTLDEAVQMIKAGDLLDAKSMVGLLWLKAEL